jgi:hypothetical protein
MIAVIYVVASLLAFIVYNVDCRTLTSDDIAGIKAAVTTTFSLEASYGTYCNAKISECTMGDNIGALVRLAFHDAAGNGGANGCIDFTHTTANKGLEAVVASLDEMYYSNGYDSIISKADLYVLAANTAIEFATTEPSSSRRNLQAPPGGAPPAAGPGPTMPPTTFASTLDTPPYTLSLPFRYGRVDSYSCDDAGALPGTNYTWSQVNGLFGGRMGMNVKEVVAVMGAHSLGRCEFANSGVDGGWTDSQSSFSNTFYKAMSAAIWRNDNHSNLWLDLSSQTIMLMPDVELLFSTNTMGEGTCAQFNSMQASAFCPLQSQSSAAFVAYADNIDQFFANYTTAWQKMTEYGFSDLVVDVDSSYAGTYPYLSGTPSPTAQPSAVPTAAPTFAPTISMSPTLAPSAVPTAVPSEFPTAGPSGVPTAAPTAIPTEFPTSGRPSLPPTAAPSETLVTNAPSLAPSSAPTFVLPVSISAFQTLHGMDASTWYADPNVELAFQEAVASSCGNGIDYSDVNVTDVTDVSVLAASAFRSHNKHLLDSSILVTYTIKCILKTISEESVDDITTALMSSVNAGSFSSLLQSFGQSNGVTALSDGTVTAEPNSVSFATGVPTFAPSFTPTFTPTATPTAATGATTTTGASSSNHGISTTSIIIIVVVLGVSALATVAFVCYRFFYTTAYAASNNNAGNVGETTGH